MTRQRFLVHLIMAARPNIMKIAPLYHALKEQSWAAPVLVHTGQHYDDAMAGAVMRDFALPAPDHCLHIGGGTHAEQTARTMIAYETLCTQERPDLCIVPGDVNATLACALTAKKMNIPLAHLEAGLRSGDRTMPEEINRLAVDAIADYHWTPSPDATAHLRHEGIPRGKIREVGNIMIDAYHRVADRIEANGTRARLAVSRNGYVLVTLHRPATVDHPPTLRRAIDALEKISRDITLVFPLHPRTRARLEVANLIQRLEAIDAIRLIAPQPYIGFMNLVTGARCVITDSGGVQEETSYLGIPCLTLRPNTERPITLTQGTNKLVGLDTLPRTLYDILNAPPINRPVIAGWDGAAAARITTHIKEIQSGAASIMTNSLDIAG